MKSRALAGWPAVRKGKAWASNASLQVIGTSVVVRGPPFVHGYLLRPATGAALHDTIYGKGKSSVPIRLQPYGGYLHELMERQGEEAVGGEAWSVRGRARNNQPTRCASIAGRRLFWPVAVV